MTVVNFVLINFYKALKTPVHPVSVFVYWSQLPDIVKRRYPEKWGHENEGK